MKELKLEELTIKQKLGMVTTFCMTNDPENNEYALNMIRNHAAGSVWVNWDIKNHAEVMKAIKEAADYPILIICDAESGIDGHFIGRHNSIGCTGSEELAYMFGKVTAIAGRKMGYNVICDPILDMANGNEACGGNVRALGNDKHKVAKLAIAEVKGMHDGGVLSVAKHYPGKMRAEDEPSIDSHMAEDTSNATAEDLLDYALYPYLELMKEDLLDGIMTRHGKYPNIDPDYPASLSEKVIGIIRDQGFDGFAITDALSMMGVVAKFGLNESKGLSIANGNELALIWCDNKPGYEAICECYDKGMISDERIDEAVKRILKAQHKTLTPPKYEDLTEDDLSTFERINLDSVYAKTDDGVPVAISKEGKHLFVVLTENTMNISDNGKVTVDTMDKGWYQPTKIINKLKELFPNSDTFAIPEFPTAGQNMHLLEAAVNYDDVVFITFFQSRAYIGKECFTSRIISVMEAMQITNQISTIVHFGNPYVIEDAPHVPRLIIGTTSAKNIDCALNVLSGDYPAKGILTYDVKFK